MHFAPNNKALDFLFNLNPTHTCFFCQPLLPRALNSLFSLGFLMSGEGVDSHGHPTFSSLLTTCHVMSCDKSCVTDCGPSIFCFQVLPKSTDL